MGVAMKTLLAVSCILVVAYGLSPEFQEKAMEKMMNTANECIPEVGATDADVGELMAKKPPSRKEGKCLMACFSKKMGLMENGKPSKKGGMALLEKVKADDPQLYEKILPILEECHTEMEKETETDECELAFKMAGCSEKKAKELGIDTQTVFG